MRYFILISGMILAMVATASGETYVVNPEGTGDFPTIQAAIDAVVHGDIIELTDGTFTGDGNRDLDFGGKAITVRSRSSHPEDCIIDCEGLEADPHKGFIFQSGEGEDAIVDGITITHGYSGFSEYAGSGIFCHNGSSPLISHCVLRENHAYLCAGGLYCLYSSPQVVGCTFLDNTAGHGAAVRCVDSRSTFTDCVFCGNRSSCHGGAFDLRESSVTLIRCLCRDNRSGWAGGALMVSGTAVLHSCTLWANASQTSGGGIYCFFADVELENCTIVGNTTAGGASGINSDNSSQVVVTNCIVAFGEGGPGVTCGSGGTAALSCCDVFGNTGGDWVGCIADQYGINGNICEDPRLCDPGAGDFTLQDCSPCAPFSPPNPECDLIGVWSVACGGTLVTPATWGGIKAAFR